MNFENGLCLIKDLRCNQKHVNLHFIVLDVGKAKKTHSGLNVRQCRIADRSGAINISVWAEKGDVIQPGDICRLTNGHVNLFEGCLIVNTGKIGDIKKIGEFCMLFSETPFMSDPNSEFLPKQEMDAKTTNQPLLNESPQSIPLPSPANLAVISRHADPRLNEQRSNDQRANDPRTNDPRFNNSRKQVRPTNYAQSTPINVLQAPPTNYPVTNKASFSNGQQKRPK